MAEMDNSEILWFPDHIDNGRLISVPTDKERLRGASFLDGRERFFGDGVREDALNDLANGPDAPDLPMIFHVSFCGSTLASRLLEQPGKLLVLREPRIQIDGADGLATAEQMQHIHRAIGSLQIGEQIVVKPTSWANTLLSREPVLRNIDPCFIVMGKRAFLQAVFRGGRDRISFVLRLAQHIAKVHDDGAALISEAVNIGDPLTQASRLALVALALQIDLFRGAATKMKIGADRFIDGEALIKEPVKHTQEIADMLRLATEPGDIELRWQNTASRDAKAPDREYNSADRNDERSEIEIHHGKIFDAAMDWADDAATDYPALA